MLSTTARTKTSRRSRVNQPQLIQDPERRRPITTESKNKTYVENPTKTSTELVLIRNQRPKTASKRGESKTSPYLKLVDKTWAKH